MYQDAQMILTKAVASRNTIQADSKGEENKNLLDLSPSDVVFYIGGYPANFTVSSRDRRTAIQLFVLFLTSMGFINTFLCFAPPQPPRSLNYPKYKGCIEFSSFNDKVVSLYNFQKAENINSEAPCKR